MPFTLTSALTSLAINSRSLFVLNPLTGKIFSIPKGGGDAVRIYGTAAAPKDVATLVADEDQLYWAFSQRQAGGGLDHGVKAMRVDGTGVLSRGYPPFGLTIDATQVHFQGMRVCKAP